MNYIFVGCAGVVIFILLLLFDKKGKKLPDYILGIILVVLLVNLSSVFLLNTTDPPYINALMILFELSEASIFLHGPLLWLYTSAMSLGRDLKRKDIIHFFPFLIALSYLLIGISDFYNVTSILRNLLLVSKLCSVIVYSILSLVLLKTHKEKIKNIFSNLEERKLIWLQFLCWSILGICLLATLSLFVDRFTEVSIPQFGGIFVNIALCIFIYAIGFFGLKQEFIFSNKNSSDPYPKYAKSGLDEQQSEHIFNRLQTYFIKEKPFLNPDLTLFSLAEEMDLVPNHLSQTINSNSEMNFYDFTNKFRIEDAKIKILSDEIKTKTLLGIALSVGFSSKTTFNRAFKKHTGMTPTEFRRQKIVQKINTDTRE